MARLIFVRHAPTAETGRILSGRLPGKALSAEGRERAALVAARFEGIEVNEIHSSPMQRCRETATAIARVVGKRIRANRDFNEVDYGTWAGRSLKSVSSTRLWRELMVAPSRVAFPEGERLSDVAARAVRGCEKLTHRSEHARVVVVSHGDVIKAVVSHYLGQPFDLFQRLVIGPASVSVVDLPKAGPATVPVINDTGHLEQWL